MFVCSTTIVVNEAKKSGPVWADLFVLIVEELFPAFYLLSDVFAVDFAPVFLVEIVSGFGHAVECFDE